MVGLEIYCGFTFFKDYMFGKSLACNGHIFSQLFCGDTKPCQAMETDNFQVAVCALVSGHIDVH